MEPTKIRFALDAFRYFVQPDEVDDFIRNLVGQKVLLMLDDANEMDKNCILGFYRGKACCHVSARKAPKLRELMGKLGKRSLIVEVKCHSLDQGYETAFCEIETEVPLSNDYLIEHDRRYAEWTYAGTSHYRTKVHTTLLANTDYLLESLPNPETTIEELQPVIESYLQTLTMVFAKEDKENCIKVNLMLQESENEAVKSYNSQLVETLAQRNDQEQRRALVRGWIDELKDAKNCITEANTLSKEALTERINNLRDFPDHLYDCYLRDFDTFCGNLYYNGIPEQKQREFMNGLAVCELATERLRKEHKLLPDAEPKEIEFYHFIHPSITNDDEKLRIHREIENLVRNHSLQIICQYLNDMAAEKKILLPIEQNVALKELQRMGLPDESQTGFSYQSFQKLYRKKK